MKLHEAMAQVLAGQEGLTSSEIASEINRLCLYTRGDGQLVPSSQISARANNYPNLFFRAGGRIRLAGRRQPRPENNSDYNAANEFVEPPVDEKEQKKNIKKGAITIGIITILSFLTYVGLYIKRQPK